MAAGTGLSGLTLVAWAVSSGLVISARRRKRTPLMAYAGFDLRTVYAVRYLPCARCDRPYMPHEVDDQAGTARCAECSTERPLSAEEVAR